MCGPIFSLVLVALFSCLFAPWCVSRGDPLPQEVARSLERRSPEEEDQVIAGNWTDPDLRDHPSVVVDWQKAAVQAWETVPDRPDAYRTESLSFMN